MVEEQICTRVGDGSSGATKGQDFSDRKESTSVTATSTSSSSIPNKSLDVNDYKKTSPTTRSEKSGGYVSNVFNAMDERTQGDPILWASMNDVGVDAQFAEHVRNSSTEELREEFERAKAVQDDRPEYETKKEFLGGVLISRGDESVSVEEAVNIHTIEGIDEVNSQDELDEFIKKSFRETLEVLDEYVSGQLCSELDVIASDDNITANAGKYISGVGRINMNTDKIKSKLQVESTLRHELMHGIHNEVYGVTDNAWKNYDSSVQSGTVSPSPSRLKAPEQMDFTLSTVEHAINDPFTDFRQTSAASESLDLRERVAELGEKMKEVRKGLEPEGINSATRFYQFSDAKELLTCAFTEYSTNFIEFYAMQPATADLLDDYVTGATWDKTSVSELEGQGLEPDADIPIWDVSQRAGGDEGEIVRVELSSEDVQSGPYDDEAVGLVTEANPEEGTLTILRGSFEREWSEDQIEQIDRRNWDGDLDLDMMEKRNKAPQ